MANVKPTLTLLIITTVVAALLIVSSTLLAVDESVMSEAMQKQCVSLMGEGTYRFVADWKAEGLNIDKPDGIKNLILNEKGDVIIEAVASGYEKNGIDILVGMNADGSVKGIAVVELLETPGLGSKVENPDFLAKFVGAKSEMSVVKKEPKADTEIQAITSATYSSKGMVAAVNNAINTFEEMGAVK